MPLLDLNSAIVEIHQAVDQNRRRNLRSPFFFMVGAGISYPQIPLAAQIRERCVSEARTYGKLIPPKSEAPIDSYSHWFEQAYPQPDNRQRYLRDLMDNAVISRANFRLAHLLLEKTPANLVVTANFDDLLSRALTLFGRTHIVCDHPRMLQRVDLRSDDVQIIHMHGSYWFYDCCNLKQEITERAELQKDTSFTMLSLLDNILWAHTPLVVGYSGWEGDVFMNALHRRLSTGLRTKVYWFCYKKREAEGLPQWLTINPNVCIVTPEQPEVGDRASAHSGAATESSARLLSASAAPREDPALEAAAIFDNLIAKFNLRAPELTRDPLRFFTARLKRSLIGDADKMASDVYAIHSVIARLEVLGSQADELPQRSKTESLLESFRDAVRQSKYREAIHIATAMPLAELAPEQLNELIVALEGARSALQDDSQEVLESCDRIVAASDTLAAKADLNLTLGAHIAEALYRKGRILIDTERYVESLAASDEVLQRFGDTDDPAVNKFLARSFGNKMLALWRLDRNEDADSAFRSFLQRFDHSTDSDVKVQIARAFYNKGTTVALSGRHEDALAAFDKGLLWISGDAEAGGREFAARLLANKAAALFYLGHYDQTLTTCGELSRRFEMSKDLSLQESLARALYWRGGALLNLNRSREAAAAYDELLLRFGDATEPDVQDLTRGAQLGRQAALERLNAEAKP